MAALLAADTDLILRRAAERSVRAGALQDEAGICATQAVEA